MVCVTKGALGLDLRVVWQFVTPAMPDRSAMDAGVSLSPFLTLVSLGFVYACFLVFVAPPSTYTVTFTFFPCTSNTNNAAEERT